jgi:carboxylesterase type B
LSVFSPTNAKNLPVLVYIHGGGYGLGNANQSLAEIVKANNGGFVAVGIQYRLGAFGFLSSSEVNKFGTINAGIKDQTAALKWVQKYIRQFGGDPTRVTISGESAGAGSVMLQALGNGGTFGTSLFKNVSPLKLMKDPH